MAKSLKPHVPKPGETPRRPRLTPEQTGRRVLDAALAELRADGISVGLERVSFEDAIRSADVSRTAAYRHWPHKDAFLADLVIELTEVAIPVSASRGGRATELIRSVMLDNPDGLTTRPGRTEVLDAVVRVTAADDFDVDRAEQARWRSYLALVMSVQSLPAGELRDKVSQAVAAADQGLTERIAGNYRRLIEFFGHRARVDYQSLATIGLALMRGLVLGEMARPGIASEEPGNQIPAIAFAALVASAVEPADERTWDATMIAAKLAAVETGDLFAEGEAEPAEN